MTEAARAPRQEKIFLPIFRWQRSNSLIPRLVRSDFREPQKLRGRKQETLVCARRHLRTSLLCTVCDYDRRPRGKQCISLFALEETRRVSSETSHDQRRVFFEFCFYRHSNRHAAFGGATCVQRLDDSQTSAIHINYHISLCSSSLHEPRDPSLKVVSWFFFCFIFYRGGKGPPL